MSASILGLPSLGAHTPRFDLDCDMSSKPASLYNTDRWGPSQTEQQPYPTYQTQNAQPLDRQFLLQTNFEQAAPNDNDFCHKSTPESLPSDFGDQSSRHNTLGISTADLQSLPTMFTSNDAQNDSYYSTTVSPMNTRFHADIAPPGTDTKMSFDGQMHHAAPSNYATFAPEDEPIPTKSRCDSLQSNFESQSPTMPQTTAGRRRGSEFAEPGSARAIYLEKNRKAASKCRNKQKRQQEELVETAREVERQNKILRAEVEILKSGMRDLMDLVGRHSDCPDARLKLYVQREADRLATRGPRKPLPSSFSSSPYSGLSSVDKVSSPDDE